jgi:sulfatase maturation enzyme AslB (radical SAM superfamily)
MAPSYYEKLIEFLDEKEMPTKIHLCTNLWDYYLNPEKWRPLFSHSRVTIGTSFQLGGGRTIKPGEILTKDLFKMILSKFERDFSYVPSFIAVVSEENEDLSMETIELAKELGVECKLNRAMSSGREGKPYSIGKIYNTYIDIYEAGLSQYEFNTKEMLELLKGRGSICPSNRSCDEGIRNLQPKSDSGYEYSSCGSFGDDQRYGIDFELEMEGSLITPLQNEVELKYQKEECISCPNYFICNGCFKTVLDHKEAGIVEESCKEMKYFRERATGLGLT